MVRIHPSTKTQPSSRTLDVIARAFVEGGLSEAPPVEVFSQHPKTLKMERQLDQSRKARLMITVEEDVRQYVLLAHHVLSTCGLGFRISDVSLHKLGGRKHLVGFLSHLLGVAQIVTQNDAKQNSASCNRVSLLFNALLKPSRVPPPGGVSDVLSHPVASGDMHHPVTMGLLEAGELKRTELRGSCSEHVMFRAPRTQTCPNHVSNRNIGLLKKRRPEPQK